MVREGKAELVITGGYLCRVAPHLRRNLNSVCILLQYRQHMNVHCGDT